MVTLVVVAVVGVAVGFGAGRVKNAAKLAAVNAELAKVENSAVAEVKALVAKVKSVL